MSEPQCLGQMSLLRSEHEHDEEPSVIDGAMIAVVDSKTAARLATNSARVAAGAKNRARPQGGQRQGCVYFMRFGDLVKIGFTSDLLGRIAALKPDELLATTPGTMRDEKALHARFGPHWVEGEYFRDNPEIRAYIEGLS